VGPIFLLGILAVIGTASCVSASPVNDIAEGLNDALFGGANLFAAQAILTAIVMLSCGLVLAMLKLNYIATFVVLFSILGALTAMGWANASLLLICGLFVVGMFTKRIVEYMTGGSSTDEE
jgi:hypothetical protein